MIRKLRRRHLVVGTAALALAPVGLVLGLLDRSPEPPPIRIAEPATAVALARVPGFPVELATAALGRDSMTVSARAVGPLPAADPLLYWSPSPPVGDSVLEDAIFLAPLSQRITRAGVPRRGFTSGGTLLVVSGAERRIVKTAPAPAALFEAAR